MSHANYETPTDVINDKNLSKDKKVKILMEWYDYEKQKLVAEEENMAHPQGNPKNRLPDLVRALNELGVQFGN